MNKNVVKICIADDNENITKNIAQTLSVNPKFYIVGIYTDGEGVIKSVLQGEVDIIILDLMMPNIDGIEVIEKIDEEFKKGNIKKRPGIIVISALVHDFLKFNIFAKGVNYFMTKPINMEILEKRILELYNGMQEMKMEEKISNKLKYMGIYPNLNGYKYIRQAVEILIDNPRIENNYRNEIYSVIAEKNNKTVKLVERSIINAIETSWKKEKNRWSELLNNETYINKKPSLNTALTTLAEEIGGSV